MHHWVIKSNIQDSAGKPIKRIFQEFELRGIKGDYERQELSKYSSPSNIVMRQKSVDVSSNTAYAMWGKMVLFW